MCSNSNCPPTTFHQPSTTTTTNYQQQYNYNSYMDDAGNRQIYRIWETTPEGELRCVSSGRTSSLGSKPTNTANAAGPSVAVEHPYFGPPSTTQTRHIYWDIYLPNGLLLPIQCPAQRTLAMLKQDVFIQAKK